MKYVKPFFDHYLKGAPDPHTPPVLTYATGVNQWQASPRWPMGTPTPLFSGGRQWRRLRSSRRARATTIMSRPRQAGAVLPRPIDMGDASNGSSWLVRDQRFVRDRTDVISYTTAPLTSAVHIMGPPQVDLFAATSGTDSDWVVKLIDVYPNETPEGAIQGSKPDMSGYRAADRDRDFPRPIRRQLRQAAGAKAGKVEHYRWACPT